MKLLVLAVVVSACYCARLENTYLPPAGANNAGGGPGLAAPFRPRPGGNGGAPGGGTGFGGRPGGHGGSPGPLYGPPSGPGKNGGAPSQVYGPPGGPGRGGQSGGPGAHGGFGPESHGPGPQGGFGPSSQGGFGGGGPDARANILRFDNTPSTGDGSFHFSFETDNGIKAEEEGHALPGSNDEEGGESVRGSYSYTAPDGQVIEMTYTADENGFVPHGAHLPTPPPIPEAILRSLEQNAAEEANGGGSDGSYQGGHGSYPSGGSGGRPSGGYPSGGAGGYPSGSAGGYPSGGPGGFSSGPSGSPGAGGIPGSRPGGSKPGFNSQTGYSY